MALRLGIISTARINAMILHGASQTDRVDVAAVASRDRDRAKAYARAHGIPRAFGSYEELLEDAGVDAVYVSLPNSLHVDWSVRALEAGKHVLCEKPLTREPAEAERAVETAARSGRVLQEAFMYRHNPQTARLLELVGGDAIGRLQLVRTYLRFRLSDHADIRLDPSLAGGSLMDLGCYCVHVARALAGEPERVYAEQLVGPTGVEVALQGALSFAGGVVAQFDSSFLAPRRQGLEVVGDEGTLRVRAPFRVDWDRPEIELVREDGVELVEVEERNSYTLELEHLADAAQGGEPLLPASDAVGQARTIAALYESAERRLPVEPARWERRSAPRPAG
jgi:predicted dehydrogenase